MGDFIDWLAQLSIIELYALIFLMEVVFGFVDMFLKDKGAEFRQLKDEVPGWVPNWGGYVTAVLSIVIVALLWPLVSVLTIGRWIYAAVVWTYDRWLNWRTRHWLKKHWEGGKVYGPTQDDDSISVMLRDPLDPHGDGTLRPGDPVFDAAMRGNGTHGVRRDDGSWDVTEIEGRR